ncbi:WYL domain-containing protein [Natroniella sulfidigena]|uniref:helix-turn-helix transcriptional regulator n=1 Tax=Natroniella sulfidigena TaxID=723921 RepID=UPI00200A7EF5|nr:WYL domain-containing protein [Natroniella sulfidigena]MCK8816756.1 WYL domain-containing protein [Natroniella sulfidigena]
MGTSGKVWRLIKLISLVEGKYARYDRQDIMDILDIKKSSFYRYLKELEKADIPIDYDQKAGGYKIREDYHMTPPNLTISEALALVVGGNSILSNSDLPYFKEMNMAIAKLMASLPDKTREMLSQLEDRIHFSLNTLVDYEKHGEVFNLLNDAIREESNLWIKYYSHTGNKVSERTVSPYILNLKKGFIYLIAYCHKREEVRVFRIDRIREIEVTANKFKYPEEFSLKQYLGNSWGIMRGEEDIKVKVKFSGDLARWMKESNHHRTQEIEELEDGSIIMSFVSCGFNEIKGWILKYGADAEVIEPKSLREEIKAEVKKMGEVYK